MLHCKRNREVCNLPHVSSGYPREFSNKTDVPLFWAPCVAPAWKGGNYQGSISRRALSKAPGHGETLLDHLMSVP